MAPPGRPPATKPTALPSKVQVNPDTASSDADAAPEKPTASTGDFSWRLITLLKRQYALFDTPRGLVMLHLRHADQRVRFERILNDYKTSAPPSQSLLIPQPIELEPLAVETLRTHLDLINRQGFQIEAFGRNFYRIEAVPTWLEPEQAEGFVRDIIDLLRQRGGSRKQQELVWEAVARLAVEGSYQRSDALNHTAVEQLVEALLTCQTPHTAPSGKPTFNEISWAEWARRFGGD